MYQFVIMPPALLMILTMFGVALGLLWAPFGAVICALISKRRGINPFHRAAVSAAYFVLFLAPWIYLAARMAGVSIPKPLVALAYVPVYWAWLHGPALYVYDSLDERTAYRYLWSLNLLTMVASLLMMAPIKRINPLYRGAGNAHPQRDALPNPVFAMPFAWLLGWNAVLLLWFAF